MAAREQQTDGANPFLLLRRKESESVIYTDGFDKFFDGEFLSTFINRHDTRSFDVRFSRSLLEEKP